MDDDVGDGRGVDDDVQDFVGAEFGEDDGPGRGADADVLSLVRDHGVYADGDAIRGDVGKLLEVLFRHAKAVLEGLWRDDVAKFVVVPIEAEGEDIRSGHVRQWLVEAE